VWLIDRFRLEKRVSELERVIAALDGEFKELYDRTAALQERCHREMKRTLMERARMEKAEPSGEAPAAEEAISSSGRFTSPQQLAALAAIRARRNGGL
jgi:exonuclease VII small subunit